MKYPITGCGRPTGKSFRALEEASFSNIPILVSNILNLCSRIDKNNTDATSVRALIRASFSLNETILFYWKELSLILSERNNSKVKLTSKEIDSLKGRKVEIKKGKRVETPIRLNFLDRVKSTLKIYSKLWELNYGIDYKNAGWQKLDMASKIRDRLTHPDRKGDLDVSNEEYNTVRLASKWFIDQQNEIDRLKKQRWAGEGAVHICGSGASESGERG
ncbi:MAG: hypothetical protein MUQ00_10170 [Candidatus Aminicenantes bacterium]|nr:hypothetical protein [Candidatus Aminicenantes bacterium]